MNPHCFLLDAFEDLQKKGGVLEMPEEVRRITRDYMLENNPVGAWIEANFTLTSRKDQTVQKTELYQAFLAESGAYKSQKEFSNDILKCNIGEKKVMGLRYYYGIIRRETNI